MTALRAGNALLCLLALGGALDRGPALSAQTAEEQVEPRARPDRDMLPGSFQENREGLDRAVLRGLAHLSRQQYDDGHIGNYRYRIAITALGGLAFMAGGSTVTTGPHATQVRRAVEFFLDLRGSQETEEWHINASDDGSRLHGHGFATLFLAQAHGSCGGWERREELGLRLREAVQLIIRSQEPRGGWGYIPQDTLHEGSITVTQLQALRAARDTGIVVPQATINGALQYLEDSARTRTDWAFFVYRLGTASPPSFPLAAAAISSLNAVGAYHSPTVEKGLNFMRRYVPQPGRQNAHQVRDERYTQFWFYGQLYAAQAMFQSGGSDWELWWPAIRDTLLREQAADGSWGHSSAEARYGYAYPTAVACIILQIPDRLLPILHR